MRTRILFLGSTVGALGVALVAGVIAVMLFIENRAMRTDQRLLRADLEQARTEAREWTDQRDATKADAREQRDRIEELSAELASLKKAEQERTERTTVRLPLQSHRVRAYLGKEEVGMGWLVPHQVRTNATDGQVSYEPVIVLDEAVREQVGVVRTNVVEREVVSREPAVSYTYQQAYASSWPVFWVRAAPRKTPVKQPSPPSTAPGPPQVQSPFLSREIWHPQSPRGRPGGDWISTGSGTARGLMAPANPERSSPFPARY